MEPVLVPAATLPSERLAELFTGVYAGYWHPIEVDAAALERMVATYDLDLHASRIALDAARTPLGLAMLGIRGAEAWVGGMGVVPQRRGAGLGELLTRALLEAARERRVDTVRLEVLEQNDPAHAIYRKVGFLPFRDVAVWRLAAAPDGHDGEAADVEDALAALARAGLDAPWQRAHATIVNMHAAGAPLAAFTARDGVAVYATADGRWSLLEAVATDEVEAASLLRAPFAHGAGDVLWLNGLLDGPVAGVLTREGAIQVARQHELRVTLGGAGSL